MDVDRYLDVLEGMQVMADLEFDQHGCAPP